MLISITFALAYNACILIIFGLCLILIPRKVLKEMALKMNEKDLMIYRVCGLWVVAGGIVSAFSYYALDSEIQRLAGYLFLVVHTTEAVIKMIAIPEMPKKIIANGHLALIFLLALI